MTSDAYSFFAIINSHNKAYLYLLFNDSANLNAMLVYIESIKREYSEGPQISYAEQVYVPLYCTICLSSIHTINMDW